MTRPLRLTRARVLTSEGLTDTSLCFEHGDVVDQCAGREIDLSGYWIMPGLVDVHGDAFEKHLAPRRGAMKSLDLGLMATEAELASNGITTGVLAQFYSWEGGMRGPAFAEQVFQSLNTVRERLDTTLQVQLRFETHMLEDYDAVVDVISRHNIGFVVFNDHLPHDALEKGKKPPGLTGKALKIGRNPDKHLEILHHLHNQRDLVPAAVTKLAKRLSEMGVRMGSHDENTPEQRKWWKEQGVHICEFPETLVTAEAAKAGGDKVVMGSPNLVRGGSHKGNVSALDVATLGLCDALASDYHYPSMRRAAFLLADSGVCDLRQAWRLISEGPARVLGLSDRGRLEEGQRADIVILDPQTRDICATLAGGRVTYLRGEVGDRFLA